jgi:hypothetical protein
MELMAGELLHAAMNVSLKHMFPRDASSAPCSPDIDGSGYLKAAAGRVQVPDMVASRVLPARSICPSAPPTLSGLGGQRFVRLQRSDQHSRVSRWRGQRGGSHVWVLNRKPIPNPKSAIHQRGAATSQGK